MNVYYEANVRRSNPEELGKFLMELVKNDKNAVHYKSLYDKILVSTDWYLREVALYAILYKFKIQKDYYREIAIKYLLDTNEEYEVRMWACKGLGMAYESTNDKIIICEIINIIENNEDDELIRMNCVLSVMKVIGVPDAEINVFFPIIDTNFSTLKLHFGEQLSKARDLCNNE